jgi:hypothetical protein
VVPIVVTVMITMVAAFARFFQIMAAFLRLTAVLSVLALGIAQLLFRAANFLLAPSVAIAIMVVDGLRWNRTGKEPGKNQGSNQRLAFLQHTFPPQDLHSQS